MKARLFFVFFGSDCLSVSKKKAKPQIVKKDSKDVEKPLPNRKERERPSDETETMDESDIESKLKAVFL